MAKDRDEENVQRLRVELPSAKEVLNLGFGIVGRLLVWGFVVMLGITVLAMITAAVIAVTPH